MTLHPERSPDSPDDDHSRGATAEHLIRKTRVLIGRAWDELSVKERSLALAMLLYSGILALYLRLWQESSSVKYAVTLLGVALAATIPELVGKRRRSFRILLICVPVMGVALVQITNDRANDANLRRLSSRFGDAEQRQQRQQYAFVLEAQRREALVPQPIDTVKAVKKADAGFIAKANRLSIRVASQEAYLLANYPMLAEEVLTFREDPQARLESYKRLRASNARARGEGDILVGFLDAILRSLQAEVGYLKLADVFQREVKSQYDDLESKGVRDGLRRSEICKRLATIAGGLSQMVGNYRIAGLYNHLGDLAMACERREEALGLFYNGRAVDHEHVPIYESLSYALWIVNQDSANALAYIVSGLEVSRDGCAVLEREFDDAKRNYEAARRRSPHHAATIEQRIKGYDHRAPEMRREWCAFLERMTARLELDYAYFSALELKNEADARRYITKLYHSDRQDAEYQDAMGFVLMRFAKGDKELNDAERLFRQAASGENPKAERVTQLLANAHLQDLQLLRKCFARSADPRSMGGERGAPSC